MKTKRNDPCPCGSGKKYKQCCMDKESQKQVKREVRVSQSGEINKTDLPFYEKLEIRPRMAKSFYAKDLVSFFKERITGESDKKVKALQTDLSLFIEFLENERLTTWTAFNQEIWEKLLTFSYLDLSYEQNGEQAQSFYKTVLEFAEWLENGQGSHPFGRWVKELEEQHQEEILKAVRVLEIYKEQIENPFLTGYGEISRQTLFQETGAKKLSEGVFEVKGKVDTGVELTSLMTGSAYHVHLSKEVESDIEVGTTMIGLIKEAEPDHWEIHTLDRVFPPIAKPYLYKAIGVNR